MDAETGLYYYRARYYDAENGKFISEDPIGFEAGDANLYRYVGNNPGNGVDPMGLEVLPIPSPLDDGGESALREAETAGWKGLLTKNEHFNDWKVKGEAKIERIKGDPPMIRTKGGLGAVFYEGTNGPGKDPKDCCIEIEFEYQHVVGGNSGLHVCVPPVTEGEKYDWREHVVGPGYEIQLQSSARDQAEFDAANSAARNAQRYENAKKKFAKDPKRLESIDKIVVKNQQRSVMKGSSTTGSIYGIKSAMHNVDPNNPGKYQPKVQVNNKEKDDGKIEAGAWNKMKVSLCHIGTYQEGKELKSKGMKIKVYMESGGQWVLVNSFARQKDTKSLEVGPRGGNVPLATPKRSHGDIAIQCHGDDETVFKNIRWRKVSNE